MGLNFEQYNILITIYDSVVTMRHYYKEHQNTTSDLSTTFPYRAGNVTLEKLLEACSKPNKPV